MVIEVGSEVIGMLIIGLRDGGSDFNESTGNGVGYGVGLGVGAGSGSIVGNRVDPSYYRVHSVLSCDGDLDS